VTELRLKEEGRIFSNEVPLVPLRKVVLDGLLAEAGFIKRKYFRDFERNAFTGQGLLLVVAAGK
jgi:hypothetical protein